MQFDYCLEKLPVAAFVCDAEGLITFFNAAAVKAFGRTPHLHDPADRFCRSVPMYHPDGTRVDHEHSWMAEALGENRELLDHEVIIERPDGTRSTMLAHANPFHDDEGRVAGLVNVLVDISQRQQATEVIREAHDAAEALNRAKDRFLAALSHELRTPLSPVLMILSNLEEDPDLPEKFRDEVTLMRRNIDLEAKLIDDLLDISRVITGKLRLDMHPVSIHGKIQNVIRNSLSELNRRHLRIVTELNAEPDQIVADPARLQQVFWNLLRNAAKFVPDDGEIRVRTWIEAGEPPHIWIEVQDNGIGIEPEVLPRIFDAFEQGSPEVTRQFGGMGLGLAIARTIVEMHGGTIEAHSEGTGKGATFRVNLPMNIHRPVPVATKPQPPGLESIPKVRLLLVEDHKDTANVLRRLLEREGYQIRVANSASEALQMLETEAVDVVISDLGLPDRTGYQLVAELRERHRGLKAIALSGYGMEDDIHRSLSAGFVDHLVKPVRPSQLKRVLAQVVSGNHERIRS